MSNQRFPHSKFIASIQAKCIFWIAIVSFAQLSHGDFNNLQGQFANELEEASAQANQATFDELNNGLCNGLESDGNPNSASCNGAIAAIYRNTRELVHTANDIAGTGTTTFSLGSTVGLQDLGFALRWTAGEEFAAQGNAANSFVNGQLNGLASRLNALRAGAKGFQFANYGITDEVYAGLGQQAYGGAAGDGGSNHSRLGGFFNWSLGWGEKDPTAAEDAFEFDGSSYSFGLDYRINDNFTIGGLFGYNDQSIDFDASQSIVDGGLDATGYNITPFLLYQNENFYISSSVGYQVIEFDIDRAIKYPSLNPSPFTSSTDTVAVAEADAEVLTGFVEIGYSYVMRNWVLEPYLGANMREITIDEFVERDLKNDGFDLRVDKQDIDSQELNIGLKIQATFTPKFGVLSPYFDASYYQESKDDSRIVTAQYANLPSAAIADPLVNFAVRTDTADDDYISYTAGLSAVLRGSDSDACGNVYGGIQGFLSYKFIDDLEHYEQSIVSAGLRYEFKSGSCQ